MSSYRKSELSEGSIQGGKDTVRNSEEIPYEDYLRARQEGAFVSPCGTEGCLWEGFPEWPEEFPYDAFGTGPEDSDAG